MLCIKASRPDSILRERQVQWKPFFHVLAIRDRGPRHGKVLDIDAGLLPLPNVRLTGRTCHAARPSRYDTRIATDSGSSTNEEGFI